MEPRAGFSPGLPLSLSQPVSEVVPCRWGLLPSPVFDSSPRVCHWGQAGPLQIAGTLEMQREAPLPFSPPWTSCCPFCILPNTAPPTPHFICHDPLGLSLTVCVPSPFPHFSQTDPHSVLARPHNLVLLSTLASAVPGPRTSLHLTVPRGCPGRSCLPAGFSQL